ncbi:MAG: Rpn family recombination-promoting nuclease/putative transposase [Lachnospiraceae bacterium]|nr:Rpn family recombination-promoting nuclease/putative transposase [Lachnospiraceae bacterium]
MGKSNIAVKQWLRDKQRFADLFNGTVFQGQQIVLPEDLEEIDSESSIIVTDKEKREKGIQKYRDIAMRWKQNAELAILACENQNKVHYAMPIRTMFYDCLSYTDQVRQIWKNRDEQIKNTEEEFLSQFRKEDKIYPIISLVFYYGLNPWDASRDLYGMFHQEQEIRNSEIWKQYVPNYKLNLIDAGDVEDVEKFSSDLQLIFGMLKYRKQENGIQEYIENHKEYFSNVDLETYQAVRELLHSENQLKKIVSVKNREGRIDMCTALEAIYQNGVNEGMSAGIEEGIKAMILTCCELGLSKEQILEKIIKNSSVTTDVASMLLEKYAN